MLQFFKDYGAQPYNDRARRRTGNPYDGFGLDDLRKTKADYERHAETGADDLGRPIPAREISVIRAEIAKMDRSLTRRSEAA
jgi:hypothetical protein